jgi:hypothetical protein
MSRSKQHSVHTYEWDKYYPHREDISAQLVGEYLETFGDKIAVDDVIHDGTKHTSLLHRLFTWDDRRAAEAHRRHEARDIMNKLKVVDPATGEPTRAYMSIQRGHQGHSYIHIAKVTGEEIEKKAMRELRAWVKRYRGVKKLTPVVLRVEPLVEEDEPVVRARRRA